MNYTFYDSRKKKKKKEKQEKTRNERNNRSCLRVITVGTGK